MLTASLITSNNSSINHNPFLQFFFSLVLFPAQFYITTINRFSASYTISCSSFSRVRWISRGGGGGGGGEVRPVCLFSSTIRYVCLPLYKAGSVKFHFLLSNAVKLTAERIPDPVSRTAEQSAFVLLRNN